MGGEEGLARLRAWASAVGVDWREDEAALAFPAGRAPAIVRVAIEREGESEGGHVYARFEGWRERFELGEDLGPERDEDSREEALDLLVDFVAAALFGELRVVERRRGDRLRRSLEVLVAGRWRRYRSEGELGLLAGLAERLGKVEVIRRQPTPPLTRPQAVAKAEPAGLSAAPWAGAAGLDHTRPPAELDMDGELDLHNFSPKEVAPLVREAIAVCRARGILDMRVVHGKGKGVLRRTVHALLDKHPGVESYRLGGQGEGGWGATMVRLRPPGADSG